MKLGRLKSGISLIEIMLAFLILCLATFAAAGTISFGHRGTEADFRQGEALQILVDRLNRLSSLPFSRLDSFLQAAGADEFTFSDPLEGIELGESVRIDKHSYRIRATLKRQPVVFNSLMELDFPNPAYPPAAPSTWIFRDRPEERFNGVNAPYAVIKITVAVKPVGGMTDEREVIAITFVADMES
jgi:hypothetical protein